MNKIQHSFKNDLYGIGMAILCALHCTVLPVILSISSFASLQIFMNAWVEYGIISISIVLAILSFYPAYRYHHRRLFPSVVASVGFIFLMLKFQFHLYETIWTIAGSVSIVAAHFFNWWWVRHSNTCGKVV